MAGTSLVGRRDELAAVRAACRAATAGHGSVLVVCGEPGIGKTALLAATAEAAAPWRVLATIGVEAERGVAFATLQALLWPARDALDELEATQAALLRGIVDLGPRAP